MRPDNRNHCAGGIVADQPRTANKGIRAAVARRRSVEGWSTVLFGVRMAEFGDAGADLSEEGSHRQHVADHEADLGFDHVPDDGADVGPGEILGLDQDRVDQSDDARQTNTGVGRFGLAYPRLESFNSWNWRLIQASDGEDERELNLSPYSHLQPPNHRHGHNVNCKVRKHREHGCKPD